MTEHASASRSAFNFSTMTGSSVSTSTSAWKERLTSNNSASTSWSRSRLPSSTVSLAPRAHALPDPFEEPGRIVISYLSTSLPARGWLGSTPPALSFVPEARAPPKGCWPTTAPVGLSYAEDPALAHGHQLLEGGGLAGTQIPDGAGRVGDGPSHR